MGNSSPYRHECIEKLTSGISTSEVQAHSVTNQPFAILYLYQCPLTEQLIILLKESAGLVVL